MAYASYSPIDLALDPAFRTWVLNPGPDDHGFWETFLRNHPEKRADLAEARRLVRSLRVRADEPPPDELDARWQAIQASNERTIYVLPLWRRSLAWAAMLALLLGCVGLYVLLNRPDSHFRTGPGQTRTFTLPDGSTVALNGNSSLQIRGSWVGDAPREVALEGQAFFTVSQKKNSDGRLLRFVVRTENAAVEVLGTQFDVSARHHQTRVVLKEGRVRLTEHGAVSPKTYTLKPGDLVALTPQRPVLRRQVQPEQYDPWQRNRLRFDETPLTDVAQTLCDTYGVTLRFADPAAGSQQFTGEFPGDRLDVLYRAIGEAFGYGVRIEGNAVIFSQ